MNRQTFRSSIFITALLATSAAFAGADVVKCVDQDGHVTLTDAPCGAGVQSAVVTGVAEGSPPAAAEPEADTAVLPATAAGRRVATQRVAFAPAHIQHDSWSAKRPGGRMLSRDVETLKAARLSMQVLDQASATMRHQRLAGVN